MNPSISISIFLLFSIFFSPISTSDNEDFLLLPWPIFSDPHFAGAGDGDSENLQFFCSSWRFAGEANNLAPWRKIPFLCGRYVRDYMTGKAYGFDLEMTASEAVDFARSVSIGDDGKDAWVFDVDETMLSNLPYYAEHGFGLEIFNGPEFDKWVEKAAAPAIKSTLKLYKEVLDLGFKIFLLTGRSEAQRDITVDNLKNVGFRDWEKLILRGTGDQRKSAKLYKSEKRSEIVADGYRIQGNSGDQWSDLLGSNAGNRSFKLPNPIYYIP